MGWMNKGGVGMRAGDGEEEKGEGEAQGRAVYPAMHITHPCTHTYIMNKDQQTTKTCPLARHTPVDDTTVPPKK